MVGCLLAMSLIGFRSTPAAADCGGAPGRPDRISDVRGTTWIGTFLGQNVLPDESVIKHWLVERVLAGDVPQVFSYHATGPGCYAPDFVPGRRYLVSTGDLHASSSMSTIAYRIRDDGRLRLIGYGGVPPAAYPPRLRTRDMNKAGPLLAPFSGRWREPVPGSHSFTFETRLTVLSQVVTRLALLSLGSGR